MHELFINVVCVCGMVIAIAATVVVVKFSFYYVVKRKEQKEYQLSYGPKKFVAAPPDLLEEILSPVTGPLSDLTKKRMRVSLPEPDLEPEIECGNCGVVIKSQPVGGEAREDKVFVQIYECENCGAKVEI